MTTTIFGRRWVVVVVTGSGLFGRGGFGFGFGLSRLLLLLLLLLGMSSQHAGNGRTDDGQFSLFDGTSAAAAAAAWQERTRRYSRVSDKEEEEEEEAGNDGSHTKRWVLHFRSICCYSFWAIRRDLSIIFYDWHGWFPRYTKTPAIFVSIAQDTDTVKWPGLV